MTPLLGLALICLHLLSFAGQSVSFVREAQPCSRSPAPQLLVIAFDGFRWDYFNEFDTPTLDYMAATGVHAPQGLKAAFITKTLPNFWTIATGLYQETHGIIDNSFYDPLLDDKFTLSDSRDQRDAKWWAGDPIWATAKKQGKRTGVFFWPGSEVDDENRPDFWRKYNAKVPFERRIDTALEWLLKEQVDLAMAYFNYPDHVAHKSGTFSDRVRKAVESLDALLDYLLRQLEDYNLLDRLNIMIVSDHGMTDIRPGRHLISLSDYIDIRDTLDIPQAGVFVGIIPKPDKVDEVFNSLVGAHPNMKVYLKEDIPEKYHYKNNPRVTPIVAIPDEGYLIVRYKTYGNTYIGQHGYDNDLPSMNPIFFARGPDFKKRVDSDTFETVNLYSLMCYLLQIQASPNNGSLEAVRPILTQRHTCAEMLVSP